MALFDTLRRKTSSPSCAVAPPALPDPPRSWLRDVVAAALDAYVEQNAATAWQVAETTLATLNRPGRPIAANDTTWPRNDTRRALRYDQPVRLPERGVR